MAKIQWCPQIANIEEATQILTNKFRQLKYEQSYIEMSNGNVGRIQGDALGIFIKHATRLRMKNAQMIHNHPMGVTPEEIECKGLSGMDVGFAATYNLKSIAVLDEDIRIKLTRPKKGWPPHDIMMSWWANNLDWELWGDVEIWNLT